jgi:putative CocE/NonD family hydrolase
MRASRCLFAAPLLALSLLVATSPLAAQALAPDAHPLAIPMRDGTVLDADVWMPTSSGKHPVLLVRTPYLKSAFKINEWAEYFASRGYVFVVQNVRGRGKSQGKFEAFSGEERDGYDTIEWLAAQPWSTGRVGTLGLSYLGVAQWFAARAHPPHLACMAPTASPGRWFEEIAYLGGAFNPAFALDWIDETSSPVDRDEDKPVDWTRALAHRPLLTSDSVAGRVLPLYRTWITQTTWGGYWGRLRFTPGDFASIDIPTLTITGWFDGDQPGALFYWRGITTNGRHRANDYLVVGPWRHIESFRGGSTKIGDSEFAASSILDMKAIHLAFFDWCLAQRSPRLEAPIARIFVTGANVWRDFGEYPPAAATPRELYLSSAGRANSDSGDGTLSLARPSNARPDTFTFDPHAPVPGNMDDWGIDRRAIQHRRDVLVYTSEPLDSPLEVIGAVVANIRASSDAHDTDFSAALSDLGPDGRALMLGPAVGMRRARYLNGYDREELLTPNKIENFRIELFDIAHRFERGHRIRLEISSSASPAHGVNQNTGNPIATDTTWRVAHQTVYHDRVNASSLTLPVMPK